MTENFENNMYQKYSWITLFQIQLGYLLTNMCSIIMGYIYFFYITVVLLPIPLYILSNSLFTVYNAVNNPIIGHYCDKSTRFVKRWGKRFPWIVIGIIGTAISIIFLFFIPFSNYKGMPIAVSIYLFFILVLYDTFFALLMVNLQSFFQYKVRDDDDRRVAGGFLIIAGSIGMILPSIFLPYIVDALGISQISSWTITAVIFAGVFIIVLFLMLSAIRETPEMKAHWAVIKEKVSLSFIKAFITGLRLRSFNAYNISSLLYAVTTSITLAMLPFFITFVLNLPLTGVTLPMILFLLAVPASSPLWVKLGNKWGTRKVYILGFFIMIPFYLPFLWIQNYNLLLLLFVIIGVAFGAQAVMQTPVDANVIEEACLAAKSRHEGIFNGVQSFIVTFSWAVQVILMGVIQLATGFDQNATVQPSSALFGIRLLLSIIPIIVLVIGGIAFWTLYNITPARVKEIETGLKELGL